MSAHLHDEPLDIDAVSTSIVAPRHGAVVTFVGTVREHHAGRTVTRLVYHCYPEMADAECAAIIDEAESMFDARVAIRHRVGALDIGDVAVVVTSAAAHRGTAFDATRWTIDAVKQRVPIWKQEFYSDGSTAWVDPTAPGGIAP